MGKVTKIDSLSDTINEMLLEYADQATVAMQEAIDEIAGNVRNEIRQNAAGLKMTGKYGKSWTTKKLTGERMVYKVVIYPKGSMLAHLLENGHKVANQYGKWKPGWKGTGFVKGVPHIAPAVEDGEKIIVRLIQEKLEDVK